MQLAATCTSPLFAPGSQIGTGRPSTRVASHLLVHSRVNRQASPVGKRLKAARSTIVGGILFLLPLILIIFLLSKALKLIERLSQPIVDVVGVRTVGGIAVATFVAIAALLLISFLTGMLARTRLGQAAYSSLESSILGILPQWRMARGFVESFGAEKASDVDVVLVPADAGWCLALVLEKPAGDWWTVFIPGAPHWTSGSIAYARSEQVHRTGLTFAETIMLIRRCGVGSRPVHDLLASLEHKKAL